MPPLFAAVADGDPPPTPQARPTLAAISRNDYRVRLHTLTPGRYGWLKALGPDGAPALAAVTLASGVQDSGDQASGGLLADLVLWTPLAIQAGLVAAV